MPLRVGRSGRGPQRDDGVFNSVSARAMYQGQSDQSSPPMAEHRGANPPSTNRQSCLSYSIRPTSPSRAGPPSTSDSSAASARLRLPPSLELVLPPPATAAAAAAGDGGWCRFIHSRGAAVDGRAQRCDAGTVLRASWTARPYVLCGACTPPALVARATRHPAGAHASVAKRPFTERCWLAGWWGPLRRLSSTAFDACRIVIVISSSSRFFPDLPMHGFTCMRACTLHAGFYSVHGVQLQA